MSHVRIKDIYAGMPDAKDEFYTGQEENFYASFIIPPELPIDSLLNGRKFLVSGYKGVGKTSVLYYLQNIVIQKDERACTSFVYFKSDYEEIQKSNMDFVAKKMTALVDISGEIQLNKVEFLHIWRWVFFKKIVEDNEDWSGQLFYPNKAWEKFVSQVNRISFTSTDKNVISLSSLCVDFQVSQENGVSGGASAQFERISSSERAFREITAIVDECERLFKRLVRTNVPYYLFVDEMEAFYGDTELFCRDLTLIRDMIFTIHRLNSHRKVHIVAAIRNEIVYAMDRFIPTREINKIIDGYSAPVKWSYSNTNSFEHPIIKILMKRISVACQNTPQKFQDWFPEKVKGKDTVNYILDNGWNKPRDIVRFLTAAQNDSLHCNDTTFTHAAFDNLRAEYSKNSLTEIRQELQSLYTSEEIEMVCHALRGGARVVTADTIRKRMPKGSKAREFWDNKKDDILEDFYRVGFWGNVNRHGTQYAWRWNHKKDTGVLNVDGWELVIHSALCAELSIDPNAI